MDEKTSQTLEEREAALARREEELARQQPQLAQEQQELHRRKGLLDNGDPNFKNGKEKIYDRLPVTAKQKTGKTFKVVLAPLSVNVIKM